MALAQRRVLSAEQIRRFEEDGYLVVEGLLTAAEISELATAFDAMHAQGSIPGCFTIGSPEEIARDPLQLYPRMMHPHRINPVALHYLLHPGAMDILADLLAEEPIAAQSMFYWKPP